MTQSSVSEMKAFGTYILGSFTTYTFTGLGHNTNYYAWIFVVKGTNESNANVITPTFVKKKAYTIANPTTPSNFVTSLAIMNQSIYGGTAKL